MWDISRLTAPQLRAECKHPLIVSRLPTGRTHISKAMMAKFFSRFAKQALTVWVSWSDCFGIADDRHLVPSAVGWSLSARELLVSYDSTINSLVYRRDSVRLSGFQLNLGGVAHMRRKSANNVLTDSTVSNGFPHGGAIRISIIKLTKYSVPFLPSLATGVLVRSESTRLDHLCTS